MIWLELDKKPCYEGSTVEGPQKCGSSELVHQLLYEAGPVFLSRWKLLGRPLQHGTLQLFSESSRPFFLHQYGRTPQHGMVWTTSYMCYQWHGILYTACFWVHPQLYTHTCIHTCMYVCMHMCIYLYEYASILEKMEYDLRKNQDLFLTYQIIYQLQDGRACIYIHTVYAYLQMYMHIYMYT